MLNCIKFLFVKNKDHFFYGNLTWQNLKGLADLANLTVNLSQTGDFSPIRLCQQKNILKSAN